MLENLQMFITGIQPPLLRELLQYLPRSALFALSLTAKNISEKMKPYLLEQKTEQNFLTLRKIFKAVDLDDVEQNKRGIPIYLYETNHKQLLLWQKIVVAICQDNVEMLREALVMGPNEDGFDAAKRNAKAVCLPIFHLAAACGTEKLLSFLFPVNRETVKDFLKRQYEIVSAGKFSSEKMDNDQALFLVVNVAELAGNNAALIFFESQFPTLSLLERNPSFRDLNADWFTVRGAIDCVAESGNLTMLKAMMGKKLKHVCTREKTLSHYAVHSGNTEMLRYLHTTETFKNDKNKSDKFKLTLLHEAAAWGQVKVYQFLCDKTEGLAMPFPTASASITLLFDAARQSGSLAMLETVLNHAVQSGQKIGNKEAFLKEHWVECFKWASYHGNFETIQQLDKLRPTTLKQAALEEIFKYAAWSETPDFRIFRFLATHYGMDLTHTFHWVCQNMRPSAIQFFVQALGANPVFKENKLTPYKQVKKAFEQKKLDDNPMDPRLNYLKTPPDSSLPRLMVEVRQAFKNGGSLTLLGRKKVRNTLSSMSKLDAVKSIEAVIETYSPGKPSETRRNAMDKIAIYRAEKEREEKSSSDGHQFKPGGV